MKAEQTWRAVLGELEMQMSQASFSTWLRDSKLIAFEDNIFVVGVESGFIKDWLDGRMRSTVERTLAGIVGQETSVSFVVWPEPAAPGPSSKFTLPDSVEETNPTQIVSSKRFLSLENFSKPEPCQLCRWRRSFQFPLVFFVEVSLSKFFFCSLVFFQYPRG